MAGLGLGIASLLVSKKAPLSLPLDAGAACIQLIVSDLYGHFCSWLVCVV